MSSPPSGPERPEQAIAFPPSASSQNGSETFGRRDGRDRADEDVTARLEELLAGKEAAREWLYDAFARPLFRRLRRRYSGHPGVELEDLLHDAFVLFLRDDGKLLGEYLRRTTPAERTLATLERRLWDLTCGLVSNRKRAARTRGWLVLAPADRPAPQPTPEQSLLDRDELERLDACLRRRSGRLYLYFKMRFEDGLTPREIARATGWSRRATYKLRKALDEAVRSCCERLGLAVHRLRRGER